MHRFESLNSKLDALVERIATIERQGGSGVLGLSRSGSIVDAKQHQTTSPSPQPVLAESSSSHASKLKKSVGDELAMLPAAVVNDQLTPLAPAIPQKLPAVEAKAYTTGQTYTARSILLDYRADPDIFFKPNNLKPLFNYNTYDSSYDVDRRSCMGAYAIENGLPLNPLMGKRNLPGRGSLLYWGPNPAVQAIFTRQFNKQTNIQKLNLK